MSTVEVKGIDPRSPQDIGPTKPWLPSKQKELAEKRNPRAPRTEEQNDKVTDLYTKARKEHEEQAAEEEQGGYYEDDHEDGGSSDIHSSEKEHDFSAYKNFYAGPHSMFQPRRQQHEYVSPEGE